jgi:hypothetical protein
MNKVGIAFQNTRLCGFDSRPGFAQETRDVDALLTAQENQRKAEG